MKRAMFLNREKYMAAVSVVYLALAFSNLRWHFMKNGIEGLLFILMLVLPFLIPRLGKIVFKA